MAKYPPITDATLVPIRAIELQLKSEPDLLDKADCPYSPAVKTLLRRLMGEQVAVLRSEYSEADLEREITELYEQLRTTPVHTGDPKDRMQLIKTQVELLNRMVSLKERALNARDMGRFQKIVVEILDGLITPAQRSEFIERLGSHVR